MKISSTTKLILVLAILILIFGLLGGCSSSEDLSRRYHKDHIKYIKTKRLATKVYRT